ncbi:MAG TPA: flagellar assembly protein FliW [Nocardioides sp.]
MPAHSREVERTESSDVSEIPVIEMVRPMPGFPDARRFALVEVDETGLLCDLRSVEDPGVRFLVAPPAAFFPDYAPEIDDETAAELGVTAAEDVIVLVVLRAGRSLQTTTANLLAPVLVNRTTHRAAQVILDDAALSVATPLPVG